MRTVLPFVILLGAAACSREPEVAVATEKKPAASTVSAADDSVAAVVQSPGKPSIAVRFALDGRPAVGVASRLRLDVSGDPGPLSLNLRGEGLVLDPGSIVLTIPEDGTPASQSISVRPQVAGIAEIAVKVQPMAEGGQEVLYAIPLLVGGAAAK
jgi:hypothetical protein